MVWIDRRSVPPLLERQRRLDGIRVAGVRRNGVVAELARVHLILGQSVVATGFRRLKRLGLRSPIITGTCRNADIVRGLDASCLVVDRTANPERPIDVSGSKWAESAAGLLHGVVNTNRNGAEHVADQSDGVAD